MDSWPQVLQDRALAQQIDDEKLIRWIRAEIFGAGRPGRPRGFYPTSTPIIAIDHC